MAQVVETPEQASVADGATATFNLPFTFTTRAEIEVVVVDDASGERTLQQLDVDYSIPAGDWSETGGDVVFLSGRLPAAGTRVERRRVTPAAQSETFGDDGEFRPVANETAFDRLTRMVAEAKAVGSRAATSPVGEPGLAIPPAALRRGRVLGFADTEAAAPLAVPNDAVAVADDLAAAAAARAAAEAAQGAAETAQAGAEAEKDLAVIARAGAEAAESAAGVHAADAAAYLSAFPADVIYDDEPTGRAAVLDGEHFWVKTADGLQSYRRVDALTPATAGPLIPSLEQVQDRVHEGQFYTRMAVGAGSTASYVKLEPDGDAAAIVGDGVGQRFGWIVEEANGEASVYLELSGLMSPGDGRVLTLPGGHALPPGLLQPGRFAEAVYLGASGFHLLEPVYVLQAPSYSIVLVQTDGNDHEWVLSPLMPLPNNTGENVTFRFNPPNKGAGFDVTLRILGINDADPWYLVGPGMDPENDQIADDTYTSADEILFDRPNLDVPLFRLKRVLNPTLAKLGTASAGGDAYAAWAGAGAAALTFAGSF